MQRNFTGPALYLDFDGCLHCDEVYASPERGVYVERGELFEHAPKLVAVLERFPSVQLILSTSWVGHFGFAETRARLPSALQSRVVGATYHDVRRHIWGLQTRYQQISADAQRRQLTRWVALDDDVEGWPPHQRHRLVAPNPDVGLQAPDVERLAMLLADLTSQPLSGDG